MINFKPGNAAITINKLWTDFYATATAKLLTSQIQYEEDSHIYYIYILDGNVAYVCNIYRGTVPPNSVHDQTQNDLDKAAWETIKLTLVAIPSDPTIRAKVLDGSTAADLTDTSLVVALSPNSNSVKVSSGYIKSQIINSNEDAVAIMSGTTKLTTGDNSLVVQISPNQAAIPISGSITVDTSLLAKDATLTGGTQQTKLTDGTHLATIKASNTPAVLSDTALVVASAYITAELAKQSTLSSLDGKFSSLGQKTMTASTPVVLASDQSAIKVDIGTTNGLALDATLTSGYAKAQIVDVNGYVPAVMSGYTTITTSDNSLVVQISPNQAAIPISGTVTVDTSLLAKDATLTGGTQKTKLTDGTNLATIKASSVQATPSDTALVVASAYITAELAKQSTLSSLDGKFSSLGQKAMNVSAPVVIASDQSNINVALVSGYNTVTANVGTTNGLALDATLKSGSAKTQLVDGAGDVITVKAASTASVVGDTSLVVQISPNQAAIPVTMTQADRTASGSITSTQTVSINSQGTSAVNILVTGTWTGTLTFEGSVDGSTWNTLPATNAVTNVISTTTTTNGTFEVSSGGYQNVRIRGNSVATGTATIAIDAGVGVQNVTLSNPLPAGTNVIGAVSGVSHKGMLFPGTISTNYVIATACTAKFTSGTQSYSATYTYKVVSPAGGDVSWNYADGGSDTFPMMPGYVYEVAVKQINASGTTVNDLQIIV
jgi:hypothetical protein